MKIPEYYLPLMPYLVVQEAYKFIEFIKTVFKAEEKLIVPRQDGTIMHAEFTVGKGAILFTDAASTYKPLPGGIFFLLQNLDEVYATALDNGAFSLQEIAEREYGRSAGFQDPFGNQWWLVVPGE